MSDMQGPFAEFTEAGYRELVRTAKLRFRFNLFGEERVEPHVLWRHDVDFSVHRALRIAQIDHEEGVRSTFFLMIRSSFYNLLEPTVTHRARAIEKLGHQVGLHFDGDLPKDADELAHSVARDAAILEDVLESHVRVMSFHNPGFGLHRFQDDNIGGLLNVYGRSIGTRYLYVSDSNGVWRFTPLGEVLVDPSVHEVHVLTHPEWWTPEPMPPRERVERCITGRADWTRRHYLEVLRASGRPDVTA